MGEGEGFEEDGRFERGVIDVFRIFRRPLLVTINKAGFKLGEVFEGLLTVLK